MAEREHVLSMDCWCKPKMDSYGDLDDVIFEDVFVHRPRTKIARLRDGAIGSVERGDTDG